MKVGDLVKDLDIDQKGIVVELSKTGHKSLSALVLLEDGVVVWIADECLEIINESR